jgi:hypothetical protein
MIRFANSLKSYKQRRGVTPISTDPFFRMTVEDVFRIAKRGR